MEPTKSGSDTPRRVGFAVAFILLVLMWISTGSWFFGLGIGIDVALFLLVELLVRQRRRVPRR